MGLNQGDQNRNITFIVGTLESGGIERSVTEWCLYLKTKAWVPRVVCILAKRGIFLEALQREGIEVEECLLKNNGLPPFTIRLARLLRKHKSIVHSQVAFSLVWQTWACVLAGSRGILFTQQNEYQNWNSFLPKLRLRFYYLLARPFIDYYTCVSDQVRQNLATLLGTSSSNFQVIYNATNIERFCPQSELRTAARVTLRLSENDFCIGMVASASIQKGHEFILRACVSLKAKGVTDVKLVLIGSGDFNKIETLSKDLGLIDCVQFLGNRPDVPFLLQGMDCFVLPSRWEGLPLALIEAMASGLPAVATDVTGNNEVIEHEVSGLLVPKENPQALAEAILKIKTNSELRNTLALRGMQRVRDKFSLTSTVDRYVTLYNQLR